ncbi:MAG: copper chaperone PCu(A)C [Alphaproteobacteria bacterium]|nr:copper chaperone PCu(A)C [Alphaproteobacteria bacterium]
MPSLILPSPIAQAQMAKPSAETSYNLGALQISTPWSRATPKGAPVGGAYLTITNTGTEADRFIGVTSAQAGKVELHEMRMEGTVMVMRPLANGLDLKPGAKVTLEPNGYHLMLMDLKKPLEQGGQFAATLSFEKAGKIDVTFTIAAMGARSPAAAPMKSEMDHQMEHHH